MNARSIALLSARGRIAFGAVALLAPAALARGMAGRHHTESAETVFTRMWGARDLAIGLGVVLADARGESLRGWLEAAAITDAGDAVAGLLGQRRLSRNGYLGTVSIASVSAALDLVLSRQV